VVLSVTPPVVAPGDTVAITGTNFMSTASKNTVRFHNRVATAVPYMASAGVLRVVVPQDAVSGSVSVFVAGNSTPGTGGSIEVTHPVGDVVLYDPVSAAATVSFPQPGASSTYLVIPHASSPTVPYSSVNNYSVPADPVTSITAGPSPGSAAQVAGGAALQAPRGGGTMGLRERFELHRFARARVLARQAPPLPRDAARPAHQSSAAPVQSRQFFVLNTTTGSTAAASSFSTVTAQLKYTGTHVLIYADVDTLPTGNFDGSDFRNFADKFDNTIRPSNTLHFGTESDVDGNGKVIILITPVINRLTPPNSQGFIGGFFLLNDLFAAGAGANAGTTNHGEIFYMLAADPNGDFVSGNKFSHALASSEDIRTTAHEYQHLISFSERLFHFNRVFQVTWLEEGMAHIAEDLVGMNSSNVNRARLYLQDPGGVSLENNTAPLEQRGGIYLFLRWLGDRFGNTIYRGIVQSQCTGRACIAAVTGEDFYLTVADFFAALYLQGRGINTSSVYNFQSIDPSSIQAIPVLNRTVNGTASTGQVLRSSADYLLYTNATSEFSRFGFSAPSSARLRAVFVRTQ